MNDNDEDERDCINMRLTLTFTRRIESSGKIVVEENGVIGNVTGRLAIRDATFRRGGDLFGRVTSLMSPAVAPPTGDCISTVPWQVFGLRSSGTTRIACAIAGVRFTLD